jgi:hypothetical protein
VNLREYAINFSKRHRLDRPRGPQKSSTTQFVHKLEEQFATSIVFEIVRVMSSLIRHAFLSGRAAYRRVFSSVPYQSSNLSAEKVLDLRQMGYAQIDNILSPELVLYKYSYSSSAS